MYVWRELYVIERCPYYGGVCEYSQTSRKWTPPRARKSAHLKEVSAYRRLKKYCLFVAGTTTKCPLVEVSA